MSTPIINGGGRRPVEGVRRSLQFYGCLAAALAAGGVFAVLAYESPTTAERESKRTQAAADRQGAVREDDAPPFLEERRARGETEDAVGLARRPDEPSGTTVGGDEPSQGRGRSVARADQDEELGRHTTPAPHSRGPPGE